MKPLRYLLGILGELALGGLTYIIVCCPLFKILAWLLPLIPYEVRMGPWGDVLTLTIQIATIVCLLMVDLWLHRQFFYLRCPDAKTKPKVRKPDVLPIRTVPAVVLDKSVRTRQRHRSRPDHQYFSHFQLEDGTGLWLSVTLEQYRQLSKGGRGQLTFQAKTCLRFQKDAEELH